MFYRRNLPHYQPHSGWFLSDIRLAGSLPKEAFEHIQQEFDDYKRALAATPPSATKTSDYRERKFKYFCDVDNLLHNSTGGPTWLSQNNVAQIVADSIHFYDKTKYDLSAFCIMPNHVHIVFALGAARIEASSDMEALDEIPFPLTQIMGSIKKFTARIANKLLHREGQFWQHESYDHLIRSSEELERILWYVLNNPVTAGLTKEWHNWKWTYLKDGLL
jgi:REP element-mobilizing transposase RayT